jgi:hypothetical protein
MKPRRPSLRFGSLLALLLAAACLSAQEVPLQYCDRLPAIQVEVSGKKPMLFLVDTAASSLLNLQSFLVGESQEVEIASFNGIANTRAREVNLPETRIGSYRLVGVRMLAVDLSALGKNCGRRIDGILGADLLEKMGAMIDFKRRVARFTTSEDRHDDELIATLKSDLQICFDALRAGDEKTDAECFASLVTVVQPDPVTYSSQQVLAFLREQYRAVQSEAQLEMRASDFHVMGEAIWFEYDLNLTASEGTRHTRGIALCRKLDDHWRIATLTSLHQER